MGELLIRKGTNETRILADAIKPVVMGEELVPDARQILKHIHIFDWKTSSMMRPLITIFV